MKRTFKIKKGPNYITQKEQRFTTKSGNVEDSLNALFGGNQKSEKDLYWRAYPKKKI
jgi:hypothetical protein